MKPNFKSMSIVLKLSIAAMISVIIAVLITSWISYRASSNLLSQATIDSMKASMSRQIERISNSIEMVRQDVLFLSQSDGIKGLLRAMDNDGYDESSMISEEDWKHKVEESFSILIRVKKYQQVRFIEFKNHGQEIVRVDRVRNSPQGEIIKPADKLQQKGDMPYVIKGMNFGKGQTYVSSINLNREYGVIEEPWNPTQRFVAPVFKDGNPGSKAIGIIVINTDAQQLINQIEQSDLFYISLTNSTGGLIHFYDSERDWEFEFGRGDGIDKEYPSAWKALLSNNSNVIFSDADRDLFHLTGRIPLNSNNNDFLGLVLTASMKKVRASISGLRMQIALISMMAVLIAGFLSAFTVYQLTRPIKKLIREADKLAENNQEINITITGQDEISKLSRAFLNLVKKLQISIHEAEAANIAKSNFLSSMSHELLTPLNAILGFSQILEGEFNGKLNEVQKTYVRDILGSGKHLLSLIDDILEFSKIEDGKFELHLEILDIQEILNHSLIMVRELCSEHHITMELKFDKSIKGLKLLADRRKMKQIMYNLLSNAVKFTPNNGIILVEASKSSTLLTVSITDSGIGIEKEYQEKIFKKFYQIESGLVNKTEGTGLGLSIVKTLVELHGGSIEVRSEGENKGTVFIFTIPLTVKNKQDVV